MIRFVLFFLCSSLACCQNRTDWVLLGADAGVRGLDAYSTRRMLERGGHENILPGVITNHTSTTVGYSAGVVVFNWWLGHEMRKHGHPKLARAVPIIDIGIDAPGAVNNLFVGGRK